jgi:thiol-disulfide isomerase/thioredoxin
MYEVRAPPFKGKNAAGKTFTPESFVGKVVYIDLWAICCGPCRHEKPNIKQLYDSLKGHNNFQLLSIAVTDKEDKWKNALTEDNVAWESILIIDNTSCTNY